MGRVRKLAFAVGGLAAMVMLAGCLRPDLFFFLQLHDSEVPARVDLLTGRRDTKKVVVVTDAEAALEWTGHGSVADELCGMVIGEMGRKQDRLELVPERKIRDWQDRNPHWADMDLQKVGEHFDVDYVIHLEVVDFSLQEAKNPYLLQGQVEIIVKIHDTRTDTQIFDDTYHREHPPHGSIPISDVPSEAIFREKFLRIIAREIAWYVVPHRHLEQTAQD